MLRSVCFCLFDVWQKRRAFRRKKGAVQEDLSKKESSLSLDKGKKPVKRSVRGGVSWEDEGSRATEKTLSFEERAGA